MLGFMSAVLLVYGAMHLYALGKVWLALPHSLALGAGLFCLGLAMIAAPFVAHWLERQQWHAANVAVSWVSYVWMGYLLLFCVVFLLFDLGHLLARLAGFGWPLGTAAALHAVALLAAVLFGYGLVEARQIRVAELTIHTPKLPANAALSIAQLSDLHLGITQGDAFLDRVMDRLCALRPDVVVATGDIVDGHGDDLDRLAQRFHACRPPLGAFAVTGNHEYYAGLDTSLRFLRDAGYTVLRGEAAAAGGVVFVGVDDPAGLARGQQAKLDAHAALASMPKGAFVVLLKHQPVPEPGIPYDLQLSGHIHGGQIVPFNILTRLVYGVGAGLTQLADGRWLYVSRGTGTWGPPIRLFAPPEITLVKIVHGTQQAVALN